MLLWKRGNSCRCATVRVLNLEVGYGDNASVEGRASAARYGIDLRDHRY